MNEFMRIFIRRFSGTISHRIRGRSRRCVFSKKSYCIISLLFCLGLAYAVYLTFVSYGQCSFLEVENAVSVTCDKFQHREALGNLCVDLCELSNLKPNSCLPNHLGKDVVFQASYFNNHVVIKSSKLNSEDFDQIYYLNEDGSKVHPSLSTFYSMVANTVNLNLNVNITSLNSTSLDILSKLWTLDMSNFPYLPNSLQSTAMNNIWFLLQQSEYLLLKYFEGVNIFPKIIGTCGPLYVVEFIEPLDNYFLTFYPTWKEDFVKRAKLALKILNFLEDIETNFPSLHICDVKVGHFGFDKSNDIKLLDMDMVFFEKSLIKDIVAIQNCSNDQDCSFMDCLGVCNTSSKKCEAKVTDNNFQRICRNILAGKVMQSYFGLLSSPPYNLYKELSPLIQKCFENLDGKFAQNLSNQLKHLLLSVVDNSK